MVLVSIVIGLAITHILSALSTCVHRLRGQGEPIHLDAIYLFWVGFILIWLVSFWWWEFKFQEIRTEWSYGLYLFIIGYAISLFLLATILVPNRMQGVVRTFDYFIAGRKWFFGALLFVQAIDIVDAFLKGVEWGIRPQSLVFYVFTIGPAIAGFLFERRSIQLGAAGIAFAAQVIYMFLEMGILGSW
jgi:hypothetical protein